MNYIYIYDDDDDGGDHNGWNPQRQVRVNPVAGTVYCEQGGGSRVVAGLLL